MQVIDFLTNINITIELDPSLIHIIFPQENDMLEFEHLRLYVQDLITDLEIPGNVSLKSRVNEFGNTSLKTLYRIIINGKKCRVPAIETTVVQNTDLLGFTRSMAKIIFDNRELFLTRSISNQMWTMSRVDQNSETLLNSLKEERFQGLLAELFKRGLKRTRIFKIKKISSDQKLVTTEAREPEDIIEAIHDLESLTIKVFLNKMQYPKLTKNSRDGEGSSDEKASLKQSLELMQNSVSTELGIAIPQILVRDENNLLENEFRIQLNDIRFHPIHISGSMESLVSTIVSNVETEIRKNIIFFVTLDTIKYNMELLNSLFPHLCNTALRRFDIVTLTRIFRDLLNEGISIMNLREILENLLAIKGVTDIDQSGDHLVFSPYTTNVCKIMKKTKMEELNIGDYSNCLRISLKEYVSGKYTQGIDYLKVYKMDPQLEASIRDINIHDDKHAKLIESIFNATRSLPISKSNNSTNTFIILTTMNVRRKLRTLIEKEFPMGAVLCLQELNLNIMFCLFS